MSGETHSATAGEPLVSEVRQHAALALGVPAERIELDRPLAAYGLDSLSAVELHAALEESHGAAPPLADLLAGTTLHEVADWLAAAQRPPVRTPAPLAADDVDTDFPLSAGQEALWFQEQLAPTAGTYNVVVAARTRGVTPAALRRALLVLVERHAALRTVFPLAGEQPVQRQLGVDAAPELALDLTVEDLPAGSDDDLRTKLSAAAWQPFDLAAGPLLRARLFIRPDGEQGLLLAVHHLVADFWSLGILAHEIGALGLAAAAAPASSLPPPAGRFRDFVERRAALLGGAEGERQLHFWRQELAGERGLVPDLALPTDRPRPPVQTWRGLSRVLRLPAATTAALGRLVAAEGTTLFTALLAAWQIQLGRYSGQDDFAIGAPTAGRAGRGADGWEGVVGYFVNPVALRADLGDSGAAGERPSFRQLLARARRTVSAALDHAAYPFPALAATLRPLRDPARPPMFQVMLALEPRRQGDDPGLAAFALGEDGAAIDLGGVRLTSVALAERRAQFELSLSAAETPDDGLAWSLEANADLFDAATVERLLAQLATLLAAATADPGLAIDDLPLMSPAERAQLESWSAAPAAAAGDDAPRTLTELVAEQARRSPGATALVVGEESWTYAQLLARAGDLSARLRRVLATGEEGVAAEKPVALLVERSADLVVGALGILAAGGVYLPLDPDHAPPRLRWLLEDAGAAAVVTQAHLAARLPELTVPVLLLDGAGEPGDSEGSTGSDTNDAYPPANVLPAQLAYLIYTSGSTGRPKGVAVSHAAAAEHCLAWARRYGLSAEDRVLQFPSAGFDASVEQIFSTLVAGATLVVRGREPWGPRELTAQARRHGITVIDVPTSFFVRWVEETLEDLAAGDAAELPATVRLIGISGEELRGETARRCLRSPLARARLLNCYGPTEAVVSATLHELTPADGQGGLVPIGKPLAGRVARILDRRGDRWGGRRDPSQPVGVAGELCLGGLLARGYLGRPELTAERFVPDGAGEAGARLYCTGDLARWRADGAIEFLGRLDQQVKIRGFRVEPGEIEAALAEHPEVREAAVLAVPAPTTLQTPATLQLVAFVAPALPADLRAFLAARVSDYMLPAAWLALPALPLNASGKIDRRALAERAGEALPDAAATPEAVAGGASGRRRTPTEELLAGVWAELLGRATVGVDEDFFALGGHSLLATRVVARVRRLFSIDLPVSAVFAAPTVARLSARIDAIDAIDSTDAIAVLGGSEAARRPALLTLTRRHAEWRVLSFAQRRLWFLDRLEPGSATYNMPGVVAIAGDLAVPALAAALTAVVRRHEVLRTVYRQPPVAPGGANPAIEGTAATATSEEDAAGGEPMQQVLPPPTSARLPLIDLAGLPPAAREREVIQRAREEARRPFDLARGPLFRASLVRAASDQHRLLATFHHIAADGWSLGLFLDEVSALYDALAEPFASSTPPGSPASSASPGSAALPELAAQYGDFADWQAAWMAGGALAGELDYWRRRLVAVPVLELPVDRPRPARRDHRGATRRHLVPPATVAALGDLARRQGVTGFMAALGLFQVLLARLSGQETIAVGSPVANRRLPEAERLIGLFVNSLVLDARFGDDPTLGAALDRVRRLCLDAYAHQDVPFERLVEELQPVRDLGQNPLFQVMFVLEEELPARRGAGGVTFTPLRGDSGTAKLDLLVAAVPAADGGWELLAEYPTALWDAVSIDRLLAQFHHLLAGAATAAAIATPLSGLPLLGAADRHQLLHEWNDTQPPARFGDGGARLHELVAAQAARTPKATAVVGESEQLTYAELMARAATLTAVLRRLGIGPEQRVGLCLDRRPDLIAAVLGILASGAAYVPLDPGYPPQRLALMLADSAAGALVTSTELAGSLSFDDGPVVLFEGGVVASPPSAAPPENGPAEAGGAADAGGERNLAYVIFTSGSTGRPKGVGIEHRSAVALVRWALDAFPRRDLDGVLMSTSICFDLSIFEIFVPLAAGGKLILARDVTRLQQVAAIGELTLVNAVPSPMAELVDGPLPPRLRTVNLAGEALKPDLVARLYAHPQVERVINLYGPSEDTTYSTMAVVPRNASLVTIGRPIAGGWARVLGRHGEALPIGAPGELALGGAGLARGYLGRPELTAERFVPDPFGAPGERLYRTGDRARLLADGQLEFLGRLDHQVKLHGIRIELGEIEAHLEQHPAVRQAVVALRGETPTGDRLVAYLLLAPEADPAIDPATDLAAFLRQRLPAIQVPSAWMVLPALPLSPNGKVDRRALPAPPRPGGGESVGAGDGSDTPRSDLEARLAAIWRDVLHLDRVGIHDSFFELGGHSLLAVRVAFRAGQALGVEVPVAALFQAPTVAALAAWLEQAGLTGDTSGAPAGAAAGSAAPLSFAQRRLWFLERLRPGDASYNLGVWVQLTGDLSVRDLAASLAAIVERHEPLRTVYAETDGQPHQQVLPPAASGAGLAVSDLGHLPHARREEARRTVARSLTERPFDLERGPVARFLLVGLGGEEQVLLSAFHHIATDGWSMEIFFADLAALYAAAVAGRRPPSAALAPLPWRYADYVAWQNQALAGDKLASQLAYWRQRLSGAPPLELPADRPRPAIWEARGGSVDFALDAAFAGELADLARRHGATLFTTLLTGFLVLLARHSGQSDISVGVPVAGRGRAETEGLIGLFVNTLVLRLDLDDAPTFRQLLLRVRDTANAAQAHQDVPFERLVEELQPERTTGASPLFRVMFGFLSAAHGTLRMPGLTVRQLPGEITSVRTDLAVSVHERDGRVHGWLEYAAALFDTVTVVRLQGHLFQLLRAAVAAPDRRANELAMLAAGERHQLTVEWSARPLWARSFGVSAPQMTVADHAASTVPELLLRQAAARPGEVALRGGGATVTYGELTRRAGRLARTLRRQDVRPGDRVGLLLDRGSDVVVAMLAVWQAGAAWVPLDPRLPETRLASLAGDAGLSLVLADGERRPGWGMPVLDLDAALTEAEDDANDAPLPLLAPRPHWLAYMMYTSGTTGRPKAVAIEHGGLLQTLRGWQQVFPYDAGDRMPHLAPLSFDTTLIEIFMPLLAGGQVEILRRDEILDLERLTAALLQATQAIQVPSLWRRFVDHWREGQAEGRATRFRRLHRVYVGGDRVQADLLRDLQEVFPHAEIAETYGPTEASITCAVLAVRRGAVDERPLLGRPLPGACLAIVDRQGEPCPIGVPGELLVAGGGVARGYHGRPELTADRFRPADGGRLYRTGDLTRFLSDGRIEFLGRTDHQIKVRGFRVEPGEIEALLRAQTEVRDAVVIAAPARHGGGELRLVGNVVPGDPRALHGAGRRQLISVLRAALAAALPEYMVPAAWVLLPELPLTANDKLDRRALAQALAAQETTLASDAAAAENQVAVALSGEEELLAALWAEVLGIEGTAGAGGADRIGRADDFFALGGHSLLITQLASRLRRSFGVEIPLVELFTARTLGEQGRRVAAALRRLDSEGGESGESDALDGIPPLRPLSAAHRAEPQPLSFAQERLWFLDQLEPGPRYNMPLAARLIGPLLAPALCAALAAIVGRHEALRTRFLDLRGRPSQQATAVQVELPVVDLAALPEAPRRTAARALAEQEARRPFDLGSGRLLRATLLRLAPGEHWILLTIHHIAGDGWSLGVLLDELAELYGAALGGRPARLAELPVQYADFAVWQRGWLTGRRLNREVEHWRRRLAGAPETLDLPADRPRPLRPEARGAQRPFDLAPGCGSALAILGRRHGWTPFMALLAALGAVLSRWHGHRAAAEVVVGSPIANRNRLEIERLIGFFANTLALRLEVGNDSSFVELTDRARAVCLDAYAHQDVPFEKLVGEIAPRRAGGRSPLFQVMLVLQNAPLRLALPGLAIELVDVDSATAKFDLTVTLASLGGELSGSVEYDSDLFDAATADRLMGHFRTLLAGAVADPASRVAELPLLAAAERLELTRFAAAAEPAGLAPPALLHDRVAAQAAATPAAVAVQLDGQQLSYGALAAGANGLARRLQALGVGPDVTVGLYLPRSLDAMVAVLAVLTAGGAYVALDPDYPAERLRLMVEDAAPLAVLTLRRLAATAPLGGGGSRRVEMVEIDGLAPGGADEETIPPARRPAAGNLAYVTYTSGSTGRPKGVAMTHGALSALIGWQLRTSRLGGGRTLQFTSLSFDVSFQEIFATWCAGGTLVLVAEEVRRDPAALCRVLAEERIERLFLPFVALQQLAAAAETAPVPAALREVMSAGEQLRITPQVAAFFGRLPAGAALHNQYGPAETHVATWFELAGDPAAWPERPPIGRPLDHARLLLLDAHGRQVPVGVPGEVWISGPGLARGYLARPEQTAERFLPDPFDTVAGWRPGDRMYRTGDVARLLANGVADFLGRADSQVKVRGFRIELAEVEAVLARHPAVGQAAVAVRGDSAATRRLVAYFVPLAEAPQPPAGIAGELRAFLASQLPEPMVPTGWVRLARLPLTASGKLDRAALESGRTHGLGARDDAAGWDGGDGTDFVPPRNPAEELLASIWREVLGIERVGAHDDFFALGGHSLLATQVASRLREAFGADLPLRSLFDSPSLEAMADLAVGHAAAGGGAPGGAAAGPIAPLSGRPPEPNDPDDPDDPAMAPLASLRGDAPRRHAALPEGLPPLSFAQERLWFLDRLQPGGAAYNVPLVLRTIGNLDPPRLAAALAALARRHDMLRTVFAEHDGRVVQVVQVVQLVRAADPAPLVPLVPVVPLVDVGTLPASRRESEAIRRLGELSVMPFDLARGPLWRAARIATGAPRDAPAGDSGGFLFLGFHHIVADGWSLGVLVRDMRALYAGEPLPALPIQYADFAAWQRRWLAGEALDRQLAWWRERLAGAPALELPADRPRPPVQSGRGAERRFTLDAELAGRLAALAGREGTTLFMVLAAGLFALLSRLSGQRDLSLGTPIANRNRIETENLIGFFVNTLVLRADLAATATFGALLRQVRELSLDAYAHQDVPFEKLADEIHPQRDLSRSPLFDVLVALQNAPLAAADLDGVRLEPVELPAGVAKFDLSWIFAESGEGTIAGVLQYANEIFEASSVERWSRHFAALLGELADDPHGRLDGAALLSAAERHQLLREWSSSPSLATPRAAAEQGEAVGVHRLVERQAARRPAAVAATQGDEVLTFGGLDRRADRLARRLRGHGAQPGAVVGLWLERSLDLLVAELAILKTGACYLPLDPAWPSARVDEILREARPVALVSGAARLPASRGLAWSGVIVAAHQLDAGRERTSADALDVTRDTPLPPLDAVIAGADLAYVIYTSGSSGRPKGVEVPHAGLANLVRWHRAAYAVAEGDRATLVASPAFDAATWEVWPYLAAGASLHIPDDETRLSPAKLLAWLAEAGITLSFLPTPLAEQVLAAAERQLPRGLRLRALLTGGDRLRRPPRHPLPFAVINHYGPSEYSVVTTAASLAAGAPAEKPPAIGRPIEGTRVYVVDAAPAAVPVGVAGEILIGGEGLARGYLGRPDLTAERFIPDALGGGSGDRLYRSGDLGRFGPGGSLEFVGRLDQQIKVRGFRIEPAEVEAALRQQPGVSEAVVVARQTPTGETILVGYVVAPPPGPRWLDELRGGLLAKLPEYMVPAALVQLDRLPLTANGKLDRAALPPADVARRGAGTDDGSARSYVAPRNDLERTIGGIWREILGVERIGIQESFFAAGGTSMLLARLQSRLAQALGREVPLLDLFRHPTIEAQAKNLAAPPAAAAAVLPEPIPAEAALPANTPQARQAQAASQPTAEEAGQALRVRGRVEARREAMRRRQQRGPGSRPEDGDPAAPALVEEKASE